MEATDMTHDHAGSSTLTRTPQLGYDCSRSRSPHHHEQRPCCAAAERSGRGQSEPAVPADRHYLEPQRNRRVRTHLPRRGIADPCGQERIELSVPVSARADLRHRSTRSRRPGSPHVAEWSSRGVQGSPPWHHLRLRRGKRAHGRAHPRSTP